MRLVVIEVPGLPAGATQTQEFDFQSDPYRSVWLIGRQLGSNIHLVDPSVSRNHAEILVSPQGLMVRDLGSANGTFLNEQPVSVEQPVMIRPGDRLRIGNVLTLVESGAINSSPNQQTGQQLPATPPRPAVQSPRLQLPPTASLRDDPPPATRPPLAALSQERPALPRYAPANADPPSLQHAPPVARPASRPPGPPDYRPLAEQGAPSAYGAIRPGAYPDQNRPVPPPQSPPVERGRESLRHTAKRGGGWRLPALLAVLVIIVVGAIAAYFLLNKSSSGPTSAATVSLPSAVFSSPANSEAVLGLTIAHPSAWKRSDVGTGQVLFYQADKPSTVLNIEKPPSRTILDANLAPTAALQQYMANVKANSAKAQLPTEVSQVRLKDGTPGSLVRLVFSTTVAPAVTDYAMTALSFKCGDQLYFVSAASQTADDSPQVRQDLDATIANVSCGP